MLLSALALSAVITHCLDLGVRVSTNSREAQARLIW